MNYSTTRPRVLEIVAIIIGWQQRIHHGNHGADAQCAKPGPGKLRTIGEDDEHAIFHFNAGIAQRIANAIRHPCCFAICERLIFEVKTDFVFAAFLQVVVEEVVGHIEAFRELD